LEDDFLETQKQVLESIVRGRPLPELLAALCTIVEERSGRTARAAVLLADAEGKRLYTGAAPSLPDEYNRAIDGIGIAPDVGTCSAAAARGEAVITRDIATDPRWSGLGHLPLGLGLRAAWSVPICAASGKVLGTFGTYFPEIREPTPRERRLVEVLAQTAALAIERERADHVLRHASVRNRFLAELSAATQPLAVPAEIMQTTARMLAEQLDVDRCAYAEVEDESLFVITGDYGRGVPSIIGRWPVAAFGAACERDMREGRPFVVDDTDHHPEISQADLLAYRATNIRAVICVPLHKSGVFTAAMAVHQTRPRVWSQLEIELVAWVVARCWEALERSRVARTLQESEARYRAMIQASPDCVKLVRFDGTLLQINAAGLSLLEAPDEASVLGASVYDVVAPEHKAGFQAFNERVCRGEGGKLQFEIVGLRGTRRSMESSAVPLPLANGELAHLAIVRDVSPRVLADRALADSRARLDYAVRLSGVGFWYCDLPFDELIWDTHVREHFFLPSEAKVTIETFYERIHVEDRAATRAAIEASIETHMPYDVVYRTQSSTTGEIKFIRALGGTSYDAAGAPQRFDGVTVDVTDQRRDQERLARMLEREQEEGREKARLYEHLQEQHQRKDEFLATLAHELRNPLAPIRLGIEVLERTTDPQQARKTYLMMERQIGHLVRMVDDLLDVSRVTLGKLHLKKEPVDFRNVLDSALETARSFIESRGHDLVIRMPDDALPVDVDVTRLAQVVANLLNNAAKYTPHGGRIQLAADVARETLVVRIVDNGAGIPKEMLESIFDVFTQVGRSVEHAQGGLGIGLTLVRRLVELHGGTVEASSDGPGKGSTFTMRLPLARRLASLEHESAHDDAAPERTRPLRVLIVDDNEDAAECLMMLLELQGHEAHVVHSGLDALERARSLAPDVVLLDIGLPGLDGYQVAERLRQEHAGRTPWLVAITGFGAAEDRRRSQEAGFHRHLVKPVAPAQLTEVLATAPRAR
jgi:PAS domain S-box-containing protein